MFVSRGGHDIELFSFVKFSSKDVETVSGGLLNNST